MKYKCYRNNFNSNNVEKRLLLFHSFNILNYFSIGFNDCRDRSHDPNACFRHHQTVFEAELLNYSPYQSSFILSISRNNIRAQRDDCFLVTTLGQFQHLTSASHPRQFEEESMNEKE